MKLYIHGGHFRELLDLYEVGELTNVINRVVENINHRFTKNVVEKTFESSDISITATNLLRDRERPINIREHMDVDLVTYGMMQVLDILNLEEQNICILDEHMIQIREYLGLLDLINEIDVEYLPEVKYSKEKVKDQYRHLVNEEKAQLTTHRYGDIVGRYVIYRGESGELDGIKYVNVEEYLRAVLVMGHHFQDN